jgi:hypothetical protein
LAFSQSVLLLGVVACWAKAVGANASSAIRAVVGINFMSGLHCLFAAFDPPAKFPLVPLKRGAI